MAITDLKDLLSDPRARSWEESFREGLDEMTKQEARDTLAQLFQLQLSLMEHYNRAIPNGIPQWPVDPSDKGSQRFTRDTISKAQDELFEAKHHLKQAKEHRNVDTGEFDRSEFVEEMIDAFHFYLEAMILMGVTPAEFFRAYRDKNRVNHQRIVNEFGVE